MSTPAHSARVLLAHLPAVVARQCDADGLSQRELSKRIGVPRSTLSALLSGADVKLSTALRVVEWLDRDVEGVPDSLTPAASDVLRRLRSVHGLGQAFLRIEQHGYGLLLPDGDGTLGELHRERGLTWSTWGELEALTLVAREGEAVRTPAARARRNRRTPDLSWPVRLLTERHGA